MRPEEESDLHAAVAAGDVEELRDILRKGPIFDSRTHFSTTPLMLAAQLGYEEMAQILVNAGQEVDARSRGDSLGGGLTALHYAAERGRLSICQTLLKAGANPNLTSGDKLTALHYAIQNKSEAIVEHLLKNGADPNGSKKCGRTPLTLAASRRDVPILRKLLDAGADPNVRGTYGDFPLSCTCNLDIAKELIKRGADVHMTKQDGTTLLMRAVAMGLFELITMYVQAGVNVNAKDKEGHTALMLLTHSPRTDIAELLIKAGANVNALWQPNLSVIDYIATDSSHVGREKRKKREQLIDYLRTHGGKSAAELAIN